MGNLYKGRGLFELSDTDHNVGSYFSVEDLAEILEIDEPNGFCKELECRQLLKGKRLIWGKRLERDEKIFLKKATHQ